MGKDVTSNLEIIMRSKTHGGLVHLQLSEHDGRFLHARTIQDSSDSSIIDGQIINNAMDAHDEIQSFIHVNSPTYSDLYIVTIREDARTFATHSLPLEHNSTYDLEPIEMIVQPTDDFSGRSFIFPCYAEHKTDGESYLALLRYTVGGGLAFDFQQGKLLKLDAGTTYISMNIEDRYSYALLNSPDGSRLLAVFTANDLDIQYYFNLTTFSHTPTIFTFEYFNSALGFRIHYIEGGNLIETNFRTLSLTTLCLDDEFKYATENVTTLTGVNLPIITDPTYGDVGADFGYTNATESITNNITTMTDSSASVTTIIFSEAECSELVYDGDDPYLTLSRDKDQAYDTPSDREYVYYPFTVDLEYQ